MDAIRSLSTPAAGSVEAHVVTGSPRTRVATLLAKVVDERDVDKKAELYEQAFQIVKTLDQPHAFLYEVLQGYARDVTYNKVLTTAPTNGFEATVHLMELSVAEQLADHGIHTGVGRAEWTKAASLVELRSGLTRPAIEFSTHVKEFLARQVDGNIHIADPRLAKALDQLARAQQNTGALIDVLYKGMHFGTHSLAENTINASFGAESQEACQFFYDRHVFMRTFAIVVSYAAEKAELKECQESAEALAAQPARAAEALAKITRAGELTAKIQPFQLLQLQETGRLLPDLVARVNKLDPTSTFAREKQAQIVNRMTLNLRWRMQFGEPVADQQAAYSQLSQAFRAAIIGYGPEGNPYLINNARTGLITTLLENPGRTPADLEEAKQHGAAMRDYLERERALGNNDEYFKGYDAVLAQLDAASK